MDPTIELPISKGTSRMRVLSEARGPLPQPNRRPRSAELTAHGGVDSGGLLRAFVLLPSLAMAALVFVTSYAALTSQPVSAAHGGGWHVTERVSQSSTGAPGNSDSFGSAISADGRFVAFESIADNLVPGDTNTTSDVFMRDRLAGTTERVSVSSAGTEANGASTGSSGSAAANHISVSADGRFVAFESNASNLVAADTNSATDVFVRDRLAGTTERVSVSSTGTQGNAGSGGGVSISADGRFVAFASNAFNLVAADTFTVDVFVRDRLTGTTEGVSHSLAGTPGYLGAYGPSISADGRFVAFIAAVIRAGGGSTLSVVVRDRSAGTNELVSVSLAGALGNDVSRHASISADGRFVAFESWASDLVAGDTNGVADAFVRDRLTGTTERASVSSSGEQGNGYSRSAPSISADGRFVAFPSEASNFAASNTDQAHPDIFVRDRLAGTTELVSVSSTGMSSYRISALPAISSDGRFIVFASEDNFVAGAVAWFDVFVSERGGGGDAVISGRVTDVTGAPIQGVVVHTDSHATGVTAADGTYSIVVPPGDTSLTPHEPPLSTGLFAFSPPFLKITSGVTTGYDFLATPIPELDGQTPPTTPGKTGLIVIVHGWTNAALDPVRPSDCSGSGFRAFRDFEIGLKEDLSRRSFAGDVEASKWDVQFYCWAAASWQVNPADAAWNARELGAKFSKAIKASNYTDVHLIGHSAAAWFIDAAADRLTDRSVQLTFLDPFIGASTALVGDTAKWSEGYINTDDVLARYTNDLNNQHFFNFDVTEFGNQYGSSGLDGGGNGGHGWPVDYYKCSLARIGGAVECPVNSLATVSRGISLSPAFGGSLTTDADGYRPGGCETLRPDGTILGTCGGKSTVEVVLGGVEDFGAGVLKSTTGAINGVGNLVHMLTGSPVWIEKTISVPDRATFLQFEYGFDSTAGSGILGVWVDGVRVYGALEADALPGVEATGPIPLPQPLGPGPHTVVFRLDAPTGSASSIGISNLRLGYEALIPPTLTPLVSGAIHDGAHDVVAAVAVGSAVHNRVTVAGTASTPSGTVTVSWFGNGACVAPALATSAPTTLVAGAVDLVGFEQTPASGGTYAFQASYSGDANYLGALGPCQVLAVGTAPTISGTPPSPVDVGAPYSFAFIADGNPAPTVTMDSGALPPGLALSSAGVLSGSPTTAGRYSFTLRASNGIAPDALSGALSIVISELVVAPTIAGTPPATATIGSLYSFQFTSTGTPTPTFAVSEGSLPPGLGLNGAGLLSGTPTTAGSFNFRVRAENGVSPDAVTALLTVVVQGAENQAPACSARSANVQAGQAVLITPSCSDADSMTLTYSVASQGTKGTASVVGGELRYASNPGTSGTDTFTYRASDGSLQSAPALVTVTIASAPPTFTLHVTVEDAVVIPSGTATARDADALLRLRSTLGRLGIPVTDQVDVAGIVALGGRLRPNDGARIRCGEDVTIEVGPMSETIPGSRFRNLLGQCVFIRSLAERNRVGISAMTVDLGQGRWFALGRPASSLTPAVLDAPVDVALAIGDDRGITPLQLTQRGRVWVFKD